MRTSLLLFVLPILIPSTLLSAGCSSSTGNGNHLTPPVQASSTSLDASDSGAPRFPECLQKNQGVRDYSIIYGDSGEIWKSKVTADSISIEYGKKEEGLPDVDRVVDTFSFSTPAKFRSQFAYKGKKSGGYGPLSPTNALDAASGDATLATDVHDAVQALMQGNSTAFGQDDLDFLTCVHDSLLSWAMLD